MTIGPVISRRKFLSTAAAVGLAAGLAPRRGWADDALPVTGEGEYRYRVHHHWAQLPAPFDWQTTSGVAVDKENNLYVIHEGRADRKEHPAIFVFSPEGRYIRSFGAEFQGGGHGIEVRTEGTEQFLYVCGFMDLRTIVKLTLQGEKVWQKYAPEKSGLYALDRDGKKKKKGVPRENFQPTNMAFLPDGGFFVADGYGSFAIHRYDRDGEWLSSFGGRGEGKGTFDLPHGLWIDDRPGKEPTLVVCDRVHHALQLFSLDGTYQSTITDTVTLPANVDMQGSLLMVPELMARVSIFDSQMRVIARLGDDSARVGADGQFQIRRDPDQWQPGKFVHPHDACFDLEGNIIVSEWVHTGRVSKLVREPA